MFDWGKNKLWAELTTAIKAGDAHALNLCFGRLSGRKDPLSVFKSDELVDLGNQVVKSGSVDCAKLLLGSKSFKRSIAAQQVHSMTPLVAATIEGHVEMIELFGSYCDFNAHGEQERHSALSFCLQLRDENKQVSVFDSLCRVAQKKPRESFLSGWNHMLKLAARWNQHACVRIILERWSEVSEVDCRGGIDQLLGDIRFSYRFAGPNFSLADVEDSRLADKKTIRMLIDFVKAPSDNSKEDAELNKKQWMDLTKLAAVLDGKRKGLVEMTALSCARAKRLRSEMRARHGHERKVAPSQAPQARSL